MERVGRRRPAVRCTAVAFTADPIRDLFETASVFFDVVCMGGAGFKLECVPVPFDVGAMREMVLSGRSFETYFPGQRCPPWYRAESPVDEDTQLGIVEPVGHGCQDSDFLMGSKRRKGTLLGALR